MRNTGARRQFAPDCEPYVAKTKGASAAFALFYHVVFGTKWRKPVLSEAVARRVIDLLQAVADEQAYTLLGVFVCQEHVHLLLSLKPTQAVAEVVQRLKGVSARRIMEEYTEIAEGHLWSSGYSAYTLGDRTVAQIKAYLGGQAEHHAIAPEVAE
jgi:putative transposase